MRINVDRRALVFYVFAAVVLVMLVPCPEEFHYVGVITAVTYVVLGTFSWLDSIARARSGSRRT
ncbi:MAG: hypothetical protein ACKOD2_14305 [Ilumatobacteraceae bacterium]